MKIKEGNVIDLRLVSTVMSATFFRVWSVSVKMRTIPGYINRNDSQLMALLNGQ